MNTIFKNESGELRAGWQIALFLLLLGGASAAVVIPLRLYGVTDTYSMSAASLVGALIATFLAAKVINKKPLVAVGLAVNKHTMRDLGIGCLLGWLMMTGIFGVEYVQGFVKVVAVETSFGDAAITFVQALGVFAVAAMAEEVIFRGYLFQTLARGIRFMPAAAIMAVIFGLAHYSNPNSSTFGLFNTSLVAVVLCVAYWRTRGLWLPFGIHLAWNFSQTTLYGYPTSGIHFSRIELTRLTQYGPDWLTGGAYGPEGGALATLVILLCGLYVYYSRVLRPFSGVVTLEREGQPLDTGLWGERKAA